MQQCYASNSSALIHVAGKINSLVQLNEVTAHSIACTGMNLHAYLHFISFSWLADHVTERAHFKALSDWTGQFSYLGVLPSSNHVPSAFLCTGLLFSVVVALTIFVLNHYFLYARVLNNLSLTKNPYSVAQSPTILSHTTKTYLRFIVSPSEFVLNATYPLI